ncbi:MAG: PadR family transcriptional regulator [Microbacterium sp.]|nr:PadR family transcriptional regulator [Microbacterium sp.]
MLRISPEPVDSEVSRMLLAEYFDARAASFPGQTYTRTVPAPEAFTEPTGVFVVAREDDHAIGCGGIRRLAGDSDRTRFEVKHVYIRPQGRGRGWGRVLMGDLQERARSFGADELVLDTHHTLEAAAALYAATGFQPIPAYNDNPNATRWFGKPLT